MRNLNVNKILMILAVVVLVGFGAKAFADWGMGYGDRGWGHHGQGGHHRGWGGSGYGSMMGNLNEKELKALEDERQAFFEETETLRRDIYAKDLELRSELAKENVDVKKAARLQSEISKLEAQLDQKHLEHQIKMRKINPDAGRGYMGGRGGMGYGPRYGGRCRQ
jgi:Spy/CpxP family protein refolding chaperone